MPNTPISDPDRDTIALLIPDRETAVVTVWDGGDRPLHVRRLRAGQQLAIGRGPDPQDYPNQIELAQDVARLISRNHLVVTHSPRGWMLSQFQGVRNPGWYRYWGDLAWREADIFDIRLRRGVLAYLFPGEPHYRLTVSACETQVLHPRTGKRIGDSTEPTTLPLRLGVTPAHRTVLTDALVDAVLWPPAASDGRVRSWRELSSGPGDDSARASYRRLKQLAEQEKNFRWTEASRGSADPTLLRKLIDIGEITYADVYYQRGDWPRGGLMPTQHTHQTDGQPRRNR